MSWRRRRFIVLTRVDYVRRTTRYDVWDTQTGQRVAGEYERSRDAKRHAKRLNASVAA